MLPCLAEIYVHPGGLCTGDSRSSACWACRHSSQTASSRDLSAGGSQTILNGYALIMMSELRTCNRSQHYQLLVLLDA